ncbi:autotransporter domain-containing protein [Alterisphingorhabdus coralli]|uniref:Autotransporter domain-containing protein n=1 Tax=Alterisphingorhabdus coralli TaxID=3071408 RepID=A0AA97I061_9SPHN|nr:autotransporter domain-containing protein [Parasphingorhabdus sp. SCSIO 66989]WOE73830.1 autotransporter domain-containing protein [Parasphingorhabdus sp. SCSIO 66989]
MATGCLLAVPAAAQTTVDGEEEETVVVAAGETLTVTDTGSINVADDDGVDVDGDGVTINNAGTIRSDDDEAIEGSNRNNLTVNNTGTIIADENGDKGIEAEENLTVINSGRIESVTSEAIEADGAGLVLENSGEIISTVDDAVDGSANVMITNSGLIQGGENDAIELDSGTIVNSGTIISLSSDPEGTPAFPGGPPELDAAIDFDAGDGSEDGGTITNMEGGLIEGDIGIVASPGNVEATEINMGAQTIVNFGTITGREGDAVLLGAGDDTFQQWQSGVTNGRVDGGDGEDTLIFGNNSGENANRDLANVSNEDLYSGFETIGFLAQDGSLTLTGESDLELTALGGDVILDGTVTNTFTVAENGMLTVTENGSINVEDADGIDIDGDGVTITNAGLIRSNDDEAIEGSGRNNLTVNNTGTIIADEGGDKGIEAEENLTIVNSGRIESVTSEAIEADGAGLNLTNSGEIISTVDDGVDGDDNVTIVNSGLIQGGENDAIELNSGTITNSGTIISLSSDPEGALTGIGGDPELDAAIDFDAGTPGNEDGTVINEAGGLIEGDIGIVASPGNVENSIPNQGSQTVINNGTIRGREGTAVSLGVGDDVFELQSQGVVDGIVDGGAGNDIARIGGVYNSDFLFGFEQIVLNGAIMQGNRTLNGDVTVDGPLTLNLTTDFLFINGDLTLEDTAVVNITTDFDITTVVTGQPITVVDESGTFTDNGATVTVIDDDLLLDYEVAVGSIVVTPTAANPGAGSSDGNVLLLGNTLQAALVLQSLDPAFANQINDLGSTEAFEVAANGLLPSLSTGISREIFESSNMASRFLERRFSEGGNGVWAQAGYRASDRDTRSATVSGYDADNITFAAGIDTHIGDDVLIGFSGSYSSIEIDETNGSGENIDIDSYTLSLYGSVHSDQFFLNGEIGYSFSDIQTDRNAITGQVLGDFNADGFLGRVTAGYVIEASETFNLIPTLGINYMQLDFDEYTEFGGLGLGVTRDEVTFFEGRAGLTANANFSGLDLMLRGTYAYDFDADARVVQLTFFNAPSMVASSDEPAEGRFEVDLGLGYDLSETARLDVAYNGEFADEYTSHGGFIRFRVNF